MKKSSNNNRITRINDELLREIAIIIRGELKDPRISTISSVTKVETTTDLKQAKVYISILGEDKVKDEVLKGINNANGYIRKQLATRINLRNTPELKFILDSSLEYSMHIESLIKKANESRADENE